LPRVYFTFNKEKKRKEKETPKDNNTYDTIQYNTKTASTQGPRPVLKMSPMTAVSLNVRKVYWLRVRIIQAQVRQRYHRTMRKGQIFSVLWIVKLVYLYIDLIGLGDGVVTESYGAMCGPHFVVFCCAYACGCCSSGVN
jgi:hypothetical protein